MEEVEKIAPIPANERTGNYWNALNEVIDPEIGVGIVDLGLIYRVDIQDGSATVYMTLTSMGCPAGPELMRGVETALEQFEDVKTVEVVLVWEPIWGSDMVNEDIRQMLWGDQAE